MGRFFSLVANGKSDQQSSPNPVSSLLFSNFFFCISAFFELP